MERRAERLAQSARSLGGCLVAEPGRASEVGLNRLDVSFELHRDVIMTSFPCLSRPNMTSDVVKCRIFLESKRFRAK